MSLLFYKILHLLGLFLLFAALGAATLRSRTETRGRGLVAASHGIALLLLLVSGFGLLAKLGIDGIPGWAWGKLVLWLLMGAWIAVARRLESAQALLWWALPLLGLVGAYLALYKPF